MRVLVFAYACEPATGSEAGAGWVWARLLARLGHTWVITRENNRQAIERVLSDMPERSQLRFVYVDLPQAARFWKRGSRGARLYYLLWQIAALREARRLDGRLDFDLVWHVTMSTVWLGSLAPLLRKRFVYGPVGGGVGVPWRLSSSLGVRGFLFELLRETTRTIARYVNPQARLAWSRARLILVQNPETKKWLPKRHRHKTVVLPHVMLESLRETRSPPSQRSMESRVALYAGRLLPWKGVALALRTLALLPDWRLLVCGSGPDERRLQRLARHFAVGERVDFRGPQPRAEVLRLMRDEADVFLFPSLHDEAGWVVVEALAAGLPVICLNHGGPPILGGMGVRIGSVKETVERLAEALRASGEMRVDARLPLLDETAGRVARLLEKTWSLVVRESAGRHD